MTMIRPRSDVVYGIYRGLPSEGKGTLNEMKDDDIRFIFSRDIHKDYYINLFRMLRTIF